MDVRQELQALVKDATAAGDREAALRALDQLVRLGENQPAGDELLTRLANAESRLEQMFKMLRNDREETARRIAGLKESLGARATLPQTATTELRYALLVLVTRESGWEEKIKASMTKALRALEAAG